MPKLITFSHLGRTGALVILLGCVDAFGDVRVEGGDKDQTVASEGDRGSGCGRPLCIADLTGEQRGDRVPMPNLSQFLRRTSWAVHSTGRLIKGVYYARSLDGPNAFVSFYNVCYQALEDNPFLVVDFEESTYFFDLDRNGSADEVGKLKSSGVDPADFYSRLPDATTYCYDDGHPS